MLSPPTCSVFHCGMPAEKYLKRNVYSGFLLDHNPKSNQPESRKFLNLRIEEFVNFRENEYYEYLKTFLNGKWLLSYGRIRMKLLFPPTLLSLCMINDSQFCCTGKFPYF